MPFLFAVFIQPGHDAVLQITMATVDVGRDALVGLSVEERKGTHVEAQT